MKTSWLLIVAGPNGVGKSTFIEQLITINADLSKYYICPDIFANQFRRENPHMNEHEIYRQAMLESQKLRYNKLENGENMILETVFSSDEKIFFIKRAIEKGYSVSMIFIGVDDIRINAERIMKRMMLGGHSVPLEKIKPRFLKSLENLIFGYKENLYHELFIIDNSSDITPYRFYFHFEERCLSWINKDIILENSKPKAENSNVPLWVLEVGAALINLSNSICLKDAYLSINRIIEDFSK